MALEEATALSENFGSGREWPGIWPRNGQPEKTQTDVAERSGDV